MRGVEIREEQVVIDPAERPEVAVPGSVLYVPEAKLLLVRGKKRLRAFSSVCPHKPKKKYKVHRDPKRSGNKACLRCAAHDWRWDHKGRPKGKAKKKLSAYPVEERDDGTVVVQTG